MFGGNAKQGETVLGRGVISAINLHLHPTTGDNPGGIMQSVFGLAVPLRWDLTGLSFSPWRWWGTDWNSVLQSVEVATERKNEWNE